jgi:hypothetical protein
MFPAIETRFIAATDNDEAKIEASVAGWTVVQAVLAGWTEVATVPFHGKDLALELRPGQHGLYNLPDFYRDCQATDKKTFGRHWLAANRLLDMLHLDNADIPPIAGVIDRGGYVFVPKPCSKESAAEHANLAVYDEVNGTSLQGSVFTTYEHLVATFGEPTIIDGDKTHAEWILSLQGETVTIYDWKTDSLPLERYAWHVGGHNLNAPDLVQVALDESLCDWLDRRRQDTLGNGIDRPTPEA